MLKVISFCWRLPLALLFSTMASLILGFFGYVLFEFGSFCGPDGSIYEALLNGGSVLFCSFAFYYVSYIIVKGAFNK